MYTRQISIAILCISSLLLSTKLTVSAQPQSGAKPKTPQQVKGTAEAKVISSKMIMPQATALLEQARKVHGSKALSALETFKVISELPDPSHPGQVIRQVNLIDLKQDRYRSEIWIKNRLVQAVAITGSKGFAWAPRGKRVAISASHISSIRMTSLIGVIALAAPRLGWERATFDGQTTWGKLRGGIVTVKRYGIKTQFLFAPSGLLLAQKIFDSGREIVGAFGDYRTVGGLKFAFSVSSTSGTPASGAFRFTSIKLNPRFSKSDFELPN
jgi:hypothetical protein